MKIKKIVMWVSVVCFGLTAAIALYILFTAAKFSGDIGRIMFTLMTVGVASGMSINGLNLYERKKNPLSLVSLGLIAISAVLALYLCWFRFKWNDFAKFVILISVTSILFNFVVTSVLNLKKEKLVFQMAVYAILVIFDCFVAGLLYATKATSKYAILIAAVVILAVFGSAILTVFSRKNFVYIDTNKQVAKPDDEDYIKIKKEEYESLLAKIRELEDKLNNKD